MNLYHIHKSHFWQLRWWREDSRRAKVAISCLMILLLLAVYVLADQKRNAEPDTVVAGANTTAGEQTETTEQPGETAQTQPADVQPGVTVIPRDQVGKDASAADSSENETADAGAGSDDSLPVMGRGIAWSMPAQGDFSRAFGYDYDLTYNDFRFHKGCDMKLPIGELVYAAADGVVLSVNEDDVWGGVVTIDHGSGWLTVYKCISSRVQVGEPVSGGESIGSVIDSPPAEAAEVSHLHFEVYLDEEAVDPLPLF